MQTALLLSLVATALCAPTAEPDAIKLPVGKKALLTRNNGEVDAATYLGMLQYTLQKYGKNVKLPGGVQDIVKRAVANEPLKDQVEQGIDELYYGNIVVGASTPQTFTCDFDTGSADLFVPGPTCTTAQGCSGTTRYDQGGTDEGNTTTITYGSGAVMGENYYDDVTVAGLTAKHQNVISLSTATGFANSDASSLMGMAFSTIANSRQPTYFETLMSQGTVTSPEFSFFLGRNADGNGDASELTLGGRDSSKFTGSVTQVPVIKKDYWRVALDKVIVNGKSALLSAIGIDPTKGQAAIDTGTTLIVAPNAAALSIYSRIPGAFPVPLVEGAGPTIFAFPCSSNPKVSIQFAGKPFAIDPRDFNIGQLTPDFAEFIGNNTLSEILNKEVSYCLGAIAGEDFDPTTNLYIVGDTFLKNWYSIYNYKNYKGGPSVSFAKSV